MEAPLHRSLHEELRLPKWSRQWRAREAESECELLEERKRRQKSDAGRESEWRGRMMKEHRNN